MNNTGKKRLSKSTENVSKLVIDVESEKLYQFKTQCLQDKKTMREVINNYISKYLKN